jgi:hypothetical protein
MNLETRTIQNLDKMLAEAGSATLTPEAEYVGAVVVLIDGRLVGFSSLEALREAERSTGVWFGDRVFAGEERGLVLDAVDIVDLFAGADNYVVRDMPDDEQVESLQRLLDGWCEKTQTKIFSADFDEVVVRRGLERKSV